MLTIADTPTDPTITLLIAADFATLPVLPAKEA